MNRITIYTTTTCPFCKMEKDYLESINQKYTEILVDQNPEEAQKMIALSGQMGVPFTVIERDDGKKVFILGFDKSQIDQTLGLTSSP